MNWRGTSVTEIAVEICFNELGLNRLSRALKDSENFQDFLEFVDEVAIDDTYTLALRDPIVVDGELSLDSESDFDNAVKIYESVGAIDRANAADPRLWSYLSLVTFRNYTLDRWKLNSEYLATRRWQHIVRDRALMLNPSRRALLHNSVSRLWWITDLTVNPDDRRSMPDQYEGFYGATRWMIEKSDRPVSILEREFSGDPDLLWAVIQAMASDDRTATSKGIQDVTKRIRIEGAYKDLVSLGPLLGPHLQTVVSKSAAALIQDNAQSQ